MYDRTWVSFFGDGGSKTVFMSTDVGKKNEQINHKISLTKNEQIYNGRVIG